MLSITRHLLFYFILFGFCTAFAQDGRLARLAFLNKKMVGLGSDSISLSERYAQEALRLLQSSDELNLRAKTYTSCSDVLYYMQALDSSAILANQALNMYESLKDTLGIVANLKTLGIIYSDKGHFIKAQDYLLRMMDVSEMARMKDSYLTAVGLTGFIYSRQEQYDEAIKYLKEAFEAQRDSLSLNLLKATFNLSNVLKRAGRYDEALSFINKAAIQANLLGSTIGQLKVAGMKTYIYMDLDDLVEAKESAQKCLDLAIQLSIPFEIFQGYLMMARIEEESRNYERMEELLMTASAFLGQIKTKSVLFEYYDAGYTCYKNLERTDRALYFLEKRAVLRDSIFNLEAANQREELLTRYESEKKDQEIINLSQKAEIQNLKLDQRNTLLISGGLLVLMIFSVLAVWFQRNAAIQTGRLATTQQKVLRLQMNPHFIFNSLAVIQGILTKGDHERAAAFLAKFSHMMRQTLEFSREEFIALEDEEILINDYITLQRLSTGKKFDSVVEIDPELDAFATVVPPMLAQPLVENAIKYSEIDTIKGGKLDITYKRLDDKLLLTVEDNGKGIKDHTPTSGHVSRAMEITKERIHLLEKKFKLKLVTHIESSPAGTRISIELPLIT